jgi:3-oxoacyl-(acyl-carrier-protein) synthase
MALRETKLTEVDAIVMHAPGTIKGDISEFKAIQRVFGDNLPLLTTNKWKIGHTLGASGMLNIEMAVMMLQNQQFIGIPFFDASLQKRELQKVLVNAVGFGGNAVSILIAL